jgi:hypothetical protein
MKALAILIACACVSVFAGGCSNNLRDVEIAHAKGQGTTRLYAVPHDKAVTITTDLLHHEGATFVGVNQSATGAPSPDEIIARFEPTLGVGGFVGVWLASQDAEHTNVTAVSVGLTSMQVTRALMETSFHEKFARAANAPAPAAAPAPAP